MVVEVDIKVVYVKFIDDGVVIFLNKISPHVFANDQKGKGLPLGNLTSQLLVNIYMNEFDQFVKHKLKTKYYIRYADDFVFLCEDKNCLEQLIPKISEFIENNLKLSLHPDKVFIATLNFGIDFLGWVNFSHHRVLRTSTKRRMLNKLKKNQKKEVEASYLGMLSHGDVHKLACGILDKD